MLNQDDKNNLNKFIKKIEPHFRNVPYTERLKLIKDLRGFLEKDIEDSRILGQSVSQTLGKYKNRKALANNLLQKHGFAKSERNFDGFNIFLVVLFSGTIAILIAITFFMKSLFPLFEIDDINGKLKLFGGRITLDEDDMEISSNYSTKVFINGEEIDVGALKVKPKKKGQTELKGDFPLDQVNELKISAEKGSFEIIGGAKSIIYKCNTKEVVDDYIKIKDKVLELTLAKRADCQFKLPNQLPFNFRLKKGKVKLKDLKQNFSVSLTNGDLIWEQREKLNYGMSQEQLEDLDLSWENGSLSPFSAKIDVEQGELSIK